VSDAFHNMRIVGHVSLTEADIKMTDLPCIGNGEKFVIPPDQKLEFTTTRYYEGNNMEEKKAEKSLTPGMERSRVVLESPLSNRNGHTVEENTAYLNLCLKDSIARGEAPYASHRFFPGLLNDDSAEERKLGMEMGFNWGSVAAEAVVYVDHGITGGMLEGIRLWVTQGKTVTYRALEEKNFPLADLLNHGE